MSSFHSIPQSPLPPRSQSHFSFNPSTPPPPPPPKPSALPSGRGTPANGPPLPPPPSGAVLQSYDGHAQEDCSPEQYSKHYDSSNSSAVPPGEGWLPCILENMSTRDLQDLLHRPDLQFALLNAPSTTHPSLSASQQSIKDLLAQNISLATSLQQLESHVNHQRTHTQSRLLALRALEQQYRAKISETEDALRDFSPMALYQRLNGSVQEQEALVKGIEESFLEGGGIASEREVAEFVKRIREARKVGFLRRERRERWDEGRVGGWR
ncbi:hypothetical protein BJ546DRAFT_91265 [Cryomyces antarcticus]